ncbi:MAG: hypothetical protein A2033_00050 [Bacteroidetes bacterium GWA2_31_9]|nr:MAG: hypothetical protein A2033_00050 [Bacteroidetes bacterium GWA2_31_9]
MTLIVETNDNANAKMLAAMLRNLNFVTAVTWKPEKKNKQNSSIAKQKTLTDEDWILPGRPATDEEIELMLDECEQGISISAEESKENNFKQFKAWQKKNLK